MDSQKGALLKMNYEELIDLKFNKGISTYELVRRFPDEVRRVREIALLDIPDIVLEEVLQEKNVLKRLRTLKKKFLKID